MLIMCLYACLLFPVGGLHSNLDCVINQHSSNYYLLFVYFKYCCDHLCCYADWGAVASFSFHVHFLLVYLEGCICCAIPVLTVSVVVCFVYGTFASITFRHLLFMFSTVLRDA